VTWGPWAALSIAHRAIDITPYYWLEFYIYVGTNTQRALAVGLMDKDGELIEYKDISPWYVDGGEFAPNQWQRVLVPLSDLSGSNTMIGGIRVVKDGSGEGQDTIYVDEIRLVGGVPEP